MLDALLVVFLPLVPLTILAGAVSLVVRFRGSTGVVRQQLTWLTLAGAVVALVYGVIMLATLLALLRVSPAQPVWLDVLQSSSLAAFALLPVAIGMAILQHRLFDVDVMNNCALAYGALTLGLAAVYTGSVPLLQVVLSTPAVAEPLRPARTRIQMVVDRRSYRHRHDAGRTSEASGLRELVQSTVQPRPVAVWLRPHGDRT